MTTDPIRTYLIVCRCDIRRACVGSGRARGRRRALRVRLDHGRTYRFVRFHHSDSSIWNTPKFSEIKLIKPRCRDSKEGVFTADFLRWLTKLVVTFGDQNLEEL